MGAREFSCRSLAAGSFDVGIEVYEGIRSRHGQGAYGTGRYSVARPMTSRTASEPRSGAGHEAPALFLDAEEARGSNPLADTNERAGQKDPHHLAGTSSLRLRAHEVQRGAERWQGRR
jgi:hypothetical protein